MGFQPWGDAGTLSLEVWSQDTRGPSCPWLPLQREGGVAAVAPALASPSVWAPGEVTGQRVCEHPGWSSALSSCPWSQSSWSSLCDRRLPLRRWVAEAPGGLASTVATSRSRSPEA